MTDVTALPSADEFGRFDRLEVLTFLAAGLEPLTVYGPTRPRAAASLLAIVQGIMPTEEEVIQHAFGYGPGNKIAAYRLGRFHLLEAYRGYFPDDALPSLSEIAE